MQSRWIWMRYRSTVGLKYTICVQLNLHSMHTVYLNVKSACYVSERQVKGSETLINKSNDPSSISKEIYRSKEGKHVIFYQT